MLWLFTDPARIADPLAAIARLPPGLCGVVFRHDGAPDRIALGRAVARACCGRRVALSVAGDWRLALLLGAGVHRRSGAREPHRKLRRGALVTASAHDRMEAVLARKAGASMVFLSPVFATASHPGEPALGTLRWQRNARGLGMPVLALGGVTGRSAARLPRCCAGVGAISALS